jgi:iron complex transport system substrate-binding protein
MKTRIDEIPILSPALIELRLIVKRVTITASKEDISMNDKRLKPFGIVVVVVLLISIAAAGCTSQQNATQTVATKTITDMAGRTLTVPVNITKVLGTSPPETWVAYFLAPDTLAGWNYNVSSNYTAAKYANLPVVGGWFGTTTGNYETFLSMNPNIILDGSITPGTNSNDTINDRQTHLNPIPVVEILDPANATNYAPEIKFVGDLLGAPENATKLIAFDNQMLQRINSTVANLTSSEKKKVYYAEGPQGLQTDPSGSQHSQLIDLCGGVNVATVAITPGNGKTQVSMEQVLAWNPDVIIAGDAGFYSQVYNNSNWQNINAVKNKQVYLVPSDPTGWIDRPPGVNTMIGLPWLAKVLYPDKFQDLNLTSLTKEFYADFYHYNLTNDQVTNILSSSGLKAS